MLFTIQFPFADCRRFLDSETGIIRRPSWPAPISGEFVRCFGGVRERTLGGLKFWGEDIICDIDGALRFLSLPSFLTENGRAIPIEAAFRRLYSDGLAVGKFEIGLATVGRRCKFDRVDAKGLLSHFLNLNVDVASVPHRNSTSRLAEASAPLLNAYLRGTTRCTQSNSSELRWTVAAGAPVLFLHLREHEAFALPFFTYRGPPLREPGITLECCLVPYLGKNLRMWVLTVGPGADLGIARSLRLSLMRLHAEHECIRLVCRNVISKKLHVSNGTSSSEDLQHYLNSATKRIAHSERHTKRLESGDTTIVELSRSIADTIHPGELDSLLDALRMANVRKNIVDKLAAYANSVIIAREINMSNDKYEVHGGAGPVGKNAQAHNVNITNYQQAWDGLKHQVDLETLATQLEQLQGELRNRAQKSDDFRALTEVASASEAAKANEGSRVMEHLKGAGAWALDIAQKIGVSVAVKAIQSAMGL
jgi:hypothetical protein